MSRILIVAIVDDDEPLRDALSDLPVFEGFACHPFEQASAFMPEIGRVSFDCLISDMRMPGMSGLELLEYLHDLGSDLPAIVLTAVVDEHSRARSLALGARAWVGTPVADKVLLSELRLAIQGRLRLAIQGRDAIFPQGSAE